MKKKLIALAIAGFASTAAFAQSNVTIYGIVDASIDLVDSGDGVATQGVRTNKISSNQSRIGFKGTEDLGDGLSAIFQIETAFNVDNDTAPATQTFNSRNTFVGLKSTDWGQVIAGNYDSPYKTSTRALDVFGDTLADNRNLLGQRRVLSFEQRFANTIRYDSKNLSGFTFAGAYAAGAEAAVAGQQKGKGLAVSGNYAFADAWNASLAYEKHDIGSVASGTFAGGVATAGQSEKALRLGVGYKAGPIRAGFVYEKTNDNFNAANTFDHDAWSLGGGYTVGSNEFKLAYTKIDSVDGRAAPLGGAKQWAAGVDHVLSKRTKVYALYVRLDNDDTSNLGLGGAGANTTGATAGSGVGSTPTAWQFGVRHSF